MKKIKFIKVKDRVIPVQYEHKKLVDLGNGYDLVTYGEYKHWGKRHISMNKELLEQEEYGNFGEMLLHEIGHAIYDQYKIPERAREETVVSNISKGIWKVFCDNPGFLEYFKWLLSQEAEKEEV